MIRGIRGATTVESNAQEAILEATQELLRAMIMCNGIAEDDVASVLFSATPELDDTFPAKAARMMGWTRTALMGFQEADVKHGLPYCIRVLIHWEYRQIPGRDPSCVPARGGCAAPRPAGGSAVTGGFHARNLAIVGMGLMGGSLALAVRAHADHITGIDSDERARQFCLGTRHGRQRHRRLV